MPQIIIKLGFDIKTGILKLSWLFFEILEAFASSDLLIEDHACVSFLVTLTALVAFHTFIALAALLVLLSSEMWNSDNFFSTALKI